ncbi:hypothetical protein OIV83_002098 [Microbotryomycetes sp. JL201]|nr:hypothetical protein OIV83_002098 [Microbotryomycetes sp. JL201]
MTPSAGKSRNALLDSLAQAASSQDAAHLLQALAELGAQLSSDHEQQDETVGLAQPRFRDGELMRAPMQTALTDDPFPFVEVLCPLLGHADEHVTRSAQICLHHFLNESSPREMAMAISERLTRFGESHSDDENHEAQPFTCCSSLYSEAREYQALASAYVSTKRNNGSGMTGTRNAPEILKTGAKLVQALSESNWIEPNRDRCLDLLRSFLLNLTAVLHIYVRSNLARGFLSKTEPRYTLQNGSQATQQSGRAWSSVMDGECLFGNRSLRQDLEHVRPLTLSSLLLYTEGRASPDEPLFLLSYIMQGIECNKQHLEDEDVFVLVEFLSAVSSQSQDVDIRFSAYRLLVRIVTRLVRKDEIVMMVLRDLVLDCPYGPMRAASVSLVREVVAHKFEKAEPSILLSPLFWHELGSHLFKSPQETEDERNSWSRTLETLSLLYFLLARDKLDLIQIELIEPLRRYTLITSPEGDASYASLDILRASLDRLDSVI